MCGTLSPTAHDSAPRRCGRGATCTLQEKAETVQSQAPRLPGPSRDPRADPGQVVSPSGARATRAGGERWVGQPRRWEGQERGCR